MVGLLFANIKQSFRFNEILNSLIFYIESLLER